MNTMRESVLTILEAISTLLSPPALRTGLLSYTPIHSTSQKLPTSRDIPPITLTTIPHVERSAFNDYLSQVGSLFESFQRARLEFEDGDAQVFLQAISAAKDDELTPSGRRKTSVWKRGQLAPTPLSTVPSCISMKNFASRIRALSMLSVSMRRL
jgi:vacuolar protein sorting-associated protein 54